MVSTLSVPVAWIAAALCIIEIIVVAGAAIIYPIPNLSPSGDTASQSYSYIPNAATLSAAPAGSIQQQSDANALCTFKLGISNWPSNPSTAPTPSAPSRSASLLSPPTSFSGWNCSGDVASSFPCGAGAVVWTGVSCGSGNQSNQVVQLDLAGVSLAGTISSYLSVLTNLFSLTLNSNFFFGEIPSELSALTGLTQLLLDSNMLTSTIPSELSTLSSLNYLRLNSNSLTGPVPKQLSAMSSLNLFALNANSFTGAIPKELSVLTKLSILDFGSNSLTGSIPSQLSTLSSLYFLNLGSNSLNGSIPSQLSTMHFLEDLYLDENFLTGTIPPELSSFSILSALTLNANFLTGSITSEFSAMYSLQFLYLNENFLTGSIPHELSALTLLDTIYLGSNFLNGTIPSSLSTLTMLKWLSLSANSLTGALPKELSVMVSLGIINIHSNSITGSLPSELSALPLLYSLDLSQNSLTGVIPSEFSNLQTLQTLQLFDNNLRGSIPSSFSSLANLNFVQLQYNSFTSTLASGIFSAYKNLQVLDLSNNRLEGPLPSSLSKLKSKLEYFSVSNNRFTGNPFFFLNFSSIVLVNVSYNNFNDMSTLASAASSTSSLDVYAYDCLKLKYLDISNNDLTGSLPDSLGAVFYNLILLSASNNRLLSYVPESLCNMRNLTTLLLSGLGNRSVTLNRRFVQQKSSFTIPSCLLSLPSLETAHLASNSLFGTLGEISSNMASLSLVGNLLTGTIPKSIQRSSSKLNFLQLSINRLSGTLVDDAFLGMDGDSTIDLYSNRISGDIPSSITRFAVEGGSKPNILSGNVFHCKDNKAPSNLVDYDTYSCGSSSIDFYTYVYVVVGAALVLFIAVFLFWIYWRRTNRSNNIIGTNSSYNSSGVGGSLNSSNGIDSSVQNRNGAMHLFIVYFQHRPFPTALFKGIVSLQFLVACLLVALFMALFNVGYATYDDRKEYSFKEAFCTVFDRYGWESAFIYVHGALPFVLVVISVTSLLFVYLIGFEVGSRSRAINKSEALSDRVRSSSNNAETPSTPSPSSIWVKCSSYFTKCAMRAFAFLDTPAKRWMFVLQFANVVAVTCVNVLYIFGENSTVIDTGYKKIIPIALSIFKIAWTSTFVVYLAKFGIRSKLSMHSVFVNYVFALVYVYILVPIITVYLTDHDCFFYPVFSQIDSITESYPSVMPVVECICIEKKVCDSYTCTAFVDPSDDLNSQSITPTWIYGYQCGVRIITNYVPAVLSTYTIKGVIMPLLKLFVLSFPPNSRIRNTQIVKVLLLPLTMNAMSEEELGGDEDREFRTFDYLSNLVTDLLMLLTYGILCPFLTFLVVWSVMVNEFIDHMQIGSYVYDMARVISVKFNKEDLAQILYTQDEVKSTNTGDNSGRIIENGLANISSNNPNNSTSASQKTDQIEYQFGLTSRIYLENSRDLVMMVWKPMITVILFFMTLILFDMIADVYGDVEGIVCVVLFLLFVFCLIGPGKVVGLDSIISCLRRTRSCEILDDDCEEGEEKLADATYDRSTSASMGTNRSMSMIRSLSRSLSRSTSRNSEDGTEMNPRINPMAKS